MQTFVFVLVLFAAFTHALWNFFSKKISGNFTLFWFGLAIVNLLILPYTTYQLFKSGFVTEAIPFILISIIAHSLYYYTLLYSYKKGDISTAYPIARGIGVAGTALISIYFMGEAVSFSGGAGITAILSGILFIGFSRIAGQKFQRKSYFFAIVTGCFIFTYSVADNSGVELFHPVAYINIIDLMCVILLAPFAFPEGFRKSLIMVKNNFRDTMIIGLGGVGAYILILFAFTLERASYIVALRESSVVIASLMGFVFLKERPTPYKITGILFITTGLFLLKLS